MLDQEELDKVDQLLSVWKQLSEHGPKFAALMEEVTEELTEINNDLIEAKKKPLKPEPKYPEKPALKTAGGAPIDSRNLKSTAPDDNRATGLERKV